ncbi:hypothetical protein QE422_000385 [Chryseobacterium sp. SORGH_AS 447]|uniref:hypothetical protein n=1 Tax=Chryseobacterium sp. SORGH_AS_0447 TaxID=3041769 RepID=UPI0027880424|nr:hypothetical protein [Chryseobacterium sp. SORGH_AS_0447]MDQ1160017.1 hypothetical protein [Chryseobacterium sp. SORGH_AS_0447]
MEAETNSTQKKCPSYIGKAGTQLFGVVNKDGRVQFITPLTVTEEFIKNNGNLEQRFRFTGKCIEKGCGQWDEQELKCSLSGKVQQLTVSETAEISFCPIRRQCRWFFQDGNKACFSCNEITRNMEELLVNAQP